jgi:bla regulator protein blaR1
MISDNLSAIGAALANHLWQSTFLAVVAATLTLALRKNQAQIRYRLWLAASIKFLIPFSVLINLGVRLARLGQTAETQPAFYLVMQKVSQPFSHAADYRALFSASLLLFLPRAILFLWFAGFVTVVGIGWSRWRRITAANREAKPVLQGREVDMLRKLERAAGMGRPLAFFASKTSLEPGVFGIVRPVLLWPAGISEHLEDAHLEAILGHELEHVRRRDNLFAAVHMLVEAVFWFHPLVWWLGAQLVEERERACDEAVLQLGNQAQIYAESILKTCEFCLGSPLACVSGVTGGDLKKRIVRIMKQGSTDKLGTARKLLLVATGITAVILPIAVGLTTLPLAIAQPSDANSSSQPGSPGQIYRVGKDVSAPILVFAPDPQFTEEALRAKYQGACVVSTIVDAEGKPQRVQIVRHLGMGLDKKAVEAVQQYTFTPAMRFGKPVAVQVNIEVNFRRY